MKNRFATSFIAACFCATGLLAAAPAFAQEAQPFASCGNIKVEANAKCQMEVKGGCTAKCEPVNFKARCNVKAETKCGGKCTAEIDAACSTECGGSCETSCEGDPSFSCKGSCDANCSADCSGKCEAEANKASCEGSCKASCESNCSASCEAPQVDCKGKCEASCKGSCKAKANMGCEIECRGTAQAECETELTGGCKAECEKPEGALFCDGQYIDHGGNLDKCISDLNGWLKTKINFQASGSADGECKDGKCEAEAKGEASCGGSSIANNKTNGSAPFALGLLGTLGAVAVARMRRRRG